MYFLLCYKAKLLAMENGFFCLLLSFGSIHFHSVGFKGVECWRFHYFLFPLISVWVFMHISETNIFYCLSKNQAEGLCAELNKILCYDFIDRFCGCILDNLSAMHKERYSNS